MYIVPYVCVNATAPGDRRGRFAMFQRRAWPLWRKYQ